MLTFSLRYRNPGYASSRSLVQYEMSLKGGVYF